MNRPPRGVRCSPAVLVCALFGSPCLLAADGGAPATRGVLRSNWPAFRGATADGHSPEVDLPWQWNSADNLTWRVELPGVGASSPVVWGDRIFLTASLDKGWKRLVLCIDRSDGSIRWQHVVSSGDPGPTHPMNQHASSTCVTDGEFVWSFFGKGGLFCHDLDGRLVWQRQLGEFFSVWGTAASPMLDGDRLIVNCDQDTMLQNTPPEGLASQAFLLAANKRSGKTVWQTPRPASRGWSTPVVLRQPSGRAEIVLNGPDGVHGYDPETGRELWVYRCEVKFGEPMIVAGHDLMFALSGRPGPMSAIRHSGEGDVTDKARAWGDDRKARDIASPLLVGNELYTANMTGIATCYDARSGDILWRERMNAKGYTASPILADGRVLLVSRDGETTVLEPGRTKRVLASNRLEPREDEDFLASPAVSNGQIFIRSDRALYCIGSPR